MSPGPFVATLGMCSVATYFVAFILDDHYLRSLTKPIPALALGFLSAYFGTGQGRRCLITLGMVASALGDIFLDIDGGFLFGMIAFSAAHLFYIWAFWSREGGWHLDLLLPFAVSIGWVVYTVDHALGALRYPTYLYGVLLSCMQWRAAVLLFGRYRREGVVPTLPHGLPLVGSILFAFSDSLIAMNKFYKPLNAGHVVIITYWIGQLFIATSSRPTLSEAGLTPASLDDATIAAIAASINSNKTNGQGKAGNKEE